MKNFIQFSANILAIALLVPNSLSAQNPCEVTGTTDGVTCQGQTGIISATASAGKNIRWYTMATGGSAIDTGNNLAVPNSNTTSTYYAEAFGGVAIGDSINTLAPNNGQVTAMFDCKPKVDITVTGFNFVPRSSGTYSVRIYYKQGTLVGSETTSNDWTLLGSSSGISATANNLTYIPASFSQQLNANQRYAFYIHASSGGSLGYTNGSSLGALAVSNSDIEIYQGRGGNGLFSGGTYTPRTFAGTIRYEVGGSCVSNSRTPVVLTVYPELDVDSQTVNDTTCVASTTQLFVKPNGPVNLYKWQIFNSVTSQFEDVSGSVFINNGDTLILTNITDTLDGARIRCVLDGFCGMDTSAEMYLTVNALPAVATSPIDVSAENGDNVTFSVAAVGKNIEYQWQVGANGAFANINNNGIYSGVKTNTLKVTGVSRAQNEYEFRCVISSKTCNAPSDTSNIAVLYVEPVVSVAGITNNDDIIIYPNPVTDVLNININNKKSSEFKIIDQYGRTVIANEFNTNLKKVTVNTSTLATGVYTIMIYDISGNQLKKERFSRL